MINGKGTPWLFVGTDVASGVAQRSLAEARIDVNVLRSSSVETPVLIDVGARYDGIVYIWEFIKERTAHQ